LGSLRRSSEDLKQKEKRKRKSSTKSEEISSGSSRIDDKPIECQWYISYNIALASFLVPLVATTSQNLSVTTSVKEISVRKRKKEKEQTYD